MRQTGRDQNVKSSFARALFVFVVVVLEIEILREALCRSRAVVGVVLLNSEDSFERGHFFNFFTFFSSSLITSHMRII